MDRETLTARLDGLKAKRRDLRATRLMLEQERRDLASYEAVRGVDLGSLRTWQANLDERFALNQDMTALGREIAAVKASLGIHRLQNRAAALAAAGGYPAII